MAIDFDDATLEIESERKRAKSSNNVGMFFSLKDGDKAKVRPLLNLNVAGKIIRHDLFNPATNKPEVNAVCSDTPALELPEGQCKHCRDAKNMTDKKRRSALSAKVHFVIPVYVYAVKNAKGEPVTYKDQDENEHPVQGVKYLQIKGTSDIMGDLLALFRGNEFTPGIDITTVDLIISREGTGLDTKYHTKDIQPPTPFTVDVPKQDRLSIIQHIAEMNPFEMLEDSGYDSFGANPPAQAKPAKASVPDF